MKRKTYNNQGMDLANGKIRSLFFKYLFAAFVSSMISNIYGIVDMAVVGQYAGPNGTAALAVIAPIWNVIYSLGLLTGIGGSILFSKLRGEEKPDSDPNEYFTIGLIMTLIIGAVEWILIASLEDVLLNFFGANETLLPICKEYFYPILFGIPVFTINNFIASFLRNDGAPLHATIAVSSSAILNMILDYTFVFPCNFGVFGAGLATIIGNTVSLLLMLPHFFSKKNTLKLVKFFHPFRKTKEIIQLGFASFFIDIAMGFMEIMFNRQIMRYFDSDALAIYGVIINIMTFTQVLGYAIGQAAQPILSINFGAKKISRIRQTVGLMIGSAFVLAALAVSISIGFPTSIIHLFMDATDNVLAIGPSIIRVYALSFIFLPINVVSTYYYQSVLQPKIAFLVSILRGLLLPTLFLYLLPLWFGKDMLWYSMFFSETIDVIVVIFFYLRSRKQLNVCQNIG